MTLTSTSDSKSASPDSSSNLIKMSAPPLSIVILTIISLLIAIVMMALSVANFGMPSVSMVVGLNLLYHIVFIFVVFIHRKNFSSAIEHHTERAEDKSFDYFDMAPLKPQSIAFSKWNITCLVFLFVANFIAFSVLVDDTTDLGAMAVEPSQQWIFKIQLTQTVVLGCQLLTIATTLGISAWGRRRIILEEEDRLQEAQYEF